MDLVSPGMQENTAAAPAEEDAVPVFAMPEVPTGNNARPVTVQNAANLRRWRITRSKNAIFERVGRYLDMPFLDNKGRALIHAELPV